MVGFRLVRLDLAKPISLSLTEDEFWSTPRRSEARDRDHHPSQHSPSRSRSLSPTRSPPPDFEEEDINFGELYARAVGGNDDSGQDKDDIWGKGFLDFNENSVELPANLMDDADGYDRERDSALSRSASMSVLSEIHSDRSLLGDVRYPEEPRPRVGLPPLARGPRPQPPKSPSRQRQPAPATQTTPTLAAPATNPAVLPSPGTFFASKSGPIGALEETGITPSQRPQFYTPQTAAARADDGTPTNTVLQGQGSAEEEAGKADAQVGATPGSSSSIVSLLNSTSFPQCPGILRCSRTATTTTTTTAAGSCYFHQSYAFCFRPFATAACAGWTSRDQKTCCGLDDHSRAGKAAGTINPCRTFSSSSSATCGFCPNRLGQLCVFLESSGSLVDEFTKTHFFPKTRGRSCDG